MPTLPGRLTRPGMVGRGVGARLRPVRLGLARVPPALAILLALAAIETTAWSVATAPLQGPDEIAHFAYAQHVAETGAQPSATTGTGIVSTELNTALNAAELAPLVGSLSAKPAWTSADEQLYRQAARTLGSRLRGDGTGPNAVAQNPPLYYYLEAIPYRVGLLFGGDIFTRLALMRLFNVLFVLASVALVWVLAGEVLGRVRWLQTTATAAVVLLPQFVFMAGTINPDNLLVPEFAAAMLLAVHTLRRGPTPARVAGLTAVCGAAALTHGQGLALVPVLVLTLALSLWRHRPARRAALRVCGIGGGILLASLLALLVLSAAGGGAGAYGGEVGAVTSTPNVHGFNLSQFLSGIWQFYLPRLDFQKPALGPAYGYRQVYIETFFGTFGSLEVTFSRTVYDVIQDAAMVGLLAFYTALVTSRARLRRVWDIALVLASFFVSELFLLHYETYRHLLAVPTDPFMVGRYLLPLVPLFGLAIAITVGAMPRRVGPIVAGVILAFGILLQLGGLGLSVTRFYA